MRTLELPAGASAKEWGQIHGETYRGEIQSLAQIRLYLTVRVGQLDTEQQVLDVAARHVAVLEQFDPALAQELIGIAAGANVSPAQIVVLNHYTASQFSPLLASGAPRSFNTSHLIPASWFSHPPF